MKNRLVLLAMLVICFTGAQAAWGQWSSDPSRNLPLADKINNDQVQPKVKPLPNDQWYVSWFGADPNSPPPIGYDVYVQRLSRGGVERFRHDGRLVADLSNSSTEDYGLDVDSEGNALLAFLDTREGSNPQVTAAKIAARGKSLWGQRGVQLTSGSSFQRRPRSREPVTVARSWLGPMTAALCCRSWIGMAIRCGARESSFASPVLTTRWQTCTRRTTRA